jgi:mono/diheme cytochrome c family protein
MKNSLYISFTVSKLLDNQILKPEVLVQRLSLMALALVLLVLLVILGVHQWQVSDPYVKSVLSLNGDPVLGHAIFQMNCAGCHGVQADGHVGPSLKNISERRSNLSLIHQVISGQTPPMPQFQPSPQEMADLLSYLDTL